LFIPSNFTRAIARARELVKRKKIKKKPEKKYLKEIPKKSQIRIQVGLTVLSTSPLQN
jgi:hypothetical protein